MNLRVLLLTVAILLQSIDATTTTPCQANGLVSSYDVVVVGAGPGGSVAARRLAESNPTWKILLVERGIPYASCTSCQSASTTGDIYQEQYSGAYFESAPQTHLNNVQFPIKDTAVAGGGTSVNGATHIRGDAFRYYPTYFPANWNWDLMKLFYEKYENYTFPASFHGGAPFSYVANDRGNQGLVESDQQPLRPLVANFIAGMKHLFPNIPTYTTSSLNDGNTPGIGTSPVEVTAKGDVRVSAYTAYIRTYTGSNLKLVTNVLVNKVLFSGTAVSGVNITFFNGSATEPTTASCLISTTRVVMSAGAFGTPKILKLSGVGPAAELQRFNIPVVANVPSMGANLGDHFVLYTTYSGYTENLQNNNYPDQLTWAYYNTQDLGPSGLNDFAFNIAKTSTPGIVFMTTSRTNLHATGTVTLASADAHATPTVDFNYFGDEADKNASAVAIFKLRQLGALLNLTANPDPCTGKVCNTPMDVFNAYVNGGYYSVGYHFTSTASLCDVVNPVSLRVEGTTGLYVLDASIMPHPPAANAQASVYAVAEYGALLINVNMHLDSAGTAIEELLGWAFCEL